MNLVRVEVDILANLLGGVTPIVPFLYAYSKLLTKASKSAE